MNLESLHLHYYIPYRQLKNQTPKNWNTDIVNGKRFYIFQSNYYFFLIIDIAPAFTFSEERSSNGSPSVSVVFPDGYEDTLVLNKYHANEEDRIANEDHCNYLGHLANEPEACVAMTGCFGSEDVHFTILSLHAEESSLFMMTKDGKVEIIDSSFKVLTLTFWRLINIHFY